MDPSWMGGNKAMIMMHVQVNSATIDCFLFNLIKQLNLNSNMQKNQEDLKRKCSNHSAKRNNASTHSLLSTGDCRKPLLSREKSRKLLTEHQEGAVSKTGGFKSMRPLAPKSETATKSGKEYPAHSRVVQEPNHGISINLNIQNLITPKASQNPKVGVCEKHGEETNSKVERHQAGQGNVEEPKKARKVSNLRPDPDSFQFQCTEELVYKSKQVTPRNNPELKSTPRELTLTKKKEGKEKVQDVKESLKRFEAKATELDEGSGYEALMFLDTCQQQYLVQPDYIEKRQKNFTWLMRAFLVEWIMQVCYEFSLTRETFHIAVNLVDRFLEREGNLAKSEFQLVGLGAMVIASKLEEFCQPSSTDFVFSANSSYNIREINQMETRILKTLNYYLNPPTLYRWGNRLMLQWDSYIKDNPHASSHLAVIGKDNIFFKQCTESSYVNYRQAMQMLDCVLLDIQTSQYSPKLLVCGFLYLILGKEMEVFKVQQIVNEFPTSSLYLLDEKNLFNDLFNNFLHFTFGFPLVDLLPTVEYCATYFLLPPNVDKPMTPSENALGSMQLEEYCSFQTYDRNIYIVVKKRFRGLYL